MVKLDKRPDFVEPGSERHMNMLGLRRAEKDEKLQHEGLTLVDLTAFGPQAQEWYLMEILKSKVRSFRSPAPTVQSTDPLKPNYAPPMFNPDAESNRRRTIL